MTTRVQVLALLLLLPLVACSDDNGRAGLRDPTTEPTPVTPPPATVQVAYRVTGTIANTRITYFSSTQGTTQLTTDLPWAISYQTSELHPFLYLAAESPVDNFLEGSLVVQVFVNGVLFREARGEGFSVAVAASGEVP